MAKIKYIERSFHPASSALIMKALEIIEAYKLKDFNLTLRQLYYQMVAKNIIVQREDDDRPYKNFGALISDARLAGYIDWDDITDRHRKVNWPSTWETAGQIVKDAAEWFQMDRWHNQEYRVEVWIEKDALFQIAQKGCRPHQVPYYCCKGYNSQSKLHETADRIKDYADKGYQPVVIYLGDHDPSGKDITRDIREKLELFGAELEFKRIALNMEQIKKYKLPPNPAKKKDSRFKKYAAKYGDKSWELDAVPPETLVEMIDKEIKKYKDEDAWKKALKREVPQRKKLVNISKNLK